MNCPYVGLKITETTPNITKTDNDFINLLVISLGGGNSHCSPFLLLLSLLHNFLVGLGKRSRNNHLFAFRVFGKLFERDKNRDPGWSVLCLSYYKGSPSIWMAAK